MLAISAIESTAFVENLSERFRNMPKQGVQRQGRIAVAMSGGVDSLRTASLLVERGHDVFGIHMRLLPSSPVSGCCVDSATEDKEERLGLLASRLNIPLTIVDLQDAFEKLVIAPFIEAYRKGLTPNPCVFCNHRVKFGLLFDESCKLGAEYLSTGHYAKIIAPDERSSRFRLAKGSDQSKDQSYFLFALTQRQLASTIFPLGGMTKKEVMDWAMVTGAAALLPKESQEICFIPSGEYHEFLRMRSGLSSAALKGPILDLEGNQLGEHKGIMGYTIGQRRGLGIASSAPYYVVRIEPAANTIRVGRAGDLWRQDFEVDEVNWVSIPPPAHPIRAKVRIRNQHMPAPAMVIPIECSKVSVRFDQPQRAVTPGQAAVFYHDDLVLGGGTILKTGSQGC